MENAEKKFSGCEGHQERKGRNDYAVPTISLIKKKKWYTGWGRKRGAKKKRARGKKAVP